MSYYFQSSNPCICTPSTPGTPPSDDCPSDCVCLELCHITINPLDNPVAVGPCAATGTLDVTDPAFGHDTCACGANPLYWTLEYYDKDLLTTASVTSGGMLTWTTAGVDTVGKFPCVILKACCGLLSAYLYVIIGIKDLCKPDRDWETVVNKSLS